MSRTRLLQLAIACAALAFVVARSQPQELREALGRVDLLYVGLALLLNLPVLLLAPLRSGLLFRRLGHGVPAGVLMPTTVLGFVAGGLTPGASGELLRVAALRRAAGVSYEESVAAVVYERVLAIYLLLLSTGVVFALTRLPVAAAAATLVIAPALCLLPWLAARVMGLGRPLPADQGSLPLRLLAYALRTAGQIRFLLRDLALLLAWSAITLLMLAVIALQYWLLSEGAGAGVGPDAAWLALGVSTLAAALSMVPLGLGVLDGSLAVTLERLGTTIEQGSAVALLVRAAVTLPLVAAAFACYLYLQRSAGRAEMRALDADSA